MEQTDSAVRQSIARLHQCSAMIRDTPSLWPLWWLLCACEAEAARLERTLARQPLALVDTVDGEVIDLDEWRRSKAEAPLRRRQSAGGAA
ncbi:MAG: hypothetical protein JO255_12815 [Alphaproteobacteria bacterium]|nr:hypothetical protein [Alphaproteobacteria bacterium]